MIIDCHGHVSAPAELWAYKSAVLSHRGSHGRGGVRVSDDQIRAAANKKEMAPCGHLDMLHKHGTDVQLISPRPFQMLSSFEPGRVVHWFVEECNKIIHCNVELFPDTFIGIRGLPQVAGEPIENTFAELDKCINLGFRGCLLNPDPYENTGTHPPGLGERYWYPLYEKLCEYDLPAHIHATGSRQDREPYLLHFINEETTAVYDLVNSDVFQDFPDLKIVSHGGGAIPCQIGWFIAGNIYAGRDFRENFSKLYFDTVLYTEGALRLLIETVGAEHCLFGSECPGVGSQYGPLGSKEPTMDDIAPTIAGFDWLRRRKEDDLRGQRPPRVQARHLKERQAMAEIVLGMWTTHGPTLSATPEEWLLRLPADHANKAHWYQTGRYDFDTLAELRSGEGLTEKSALPERTKRHDACRAAIDRMAEVYAEVKSDVPVIFGNDQQELFNDTLMPAFTFFNGEAIWNEPSSAEHAAKHPPGIHAAE